MSRQSSQHSFGSREHTRRGSGLNRPPNAGGWRISAPASGLAWLLPLCVGLALPQSGECRGLSAEPATRAPGLPTTTLDPQASAANYAVMATSSVDASVPSITLSWSADGTATGYTIYRKLRSSTSWGQAVATLDATATFWTDTAISVGRHYEYQIYKQGSPAAYGYVSTGIELPLVDDRGVLLLLVDASQTSALAAELEQLVADLEGDGWKVIRQDVARDSAAGDVRALVQGVYAQYPDTLRSLFIFGHVPIARSGYLAPDGHEARPFPADGFYGDMDGSWTDVQNYGSSNVPGDGVYDPSSFYSPVELEVGRVDLFNLSTFSPLSETELLRQYLQKDHRYRHNQLEVQEKGFIDDNFGEFSGEAFAQNGWRNFSAFFGPSSVAAGDWLANPTPPYLWGYGCGGGSYTSCSGVATTTDLTTHDPAVFTMLFGSYFGEWNASNDLMRGVLATSGNGLTCAWAGRPNWFFHTMAMGEPIGTAARMAMNNGLDGTYYAPTNYGAAGVHIALMGDPTLRLHRLTPPESLSAVVVDGGAVELSWAASADASSGYHIYRKSSNDDRFERITTQPIVDTSFVDPDYLPGTRDYMVRGIGLESGSGGSYYNASQGTFSSVTLSSSEDYDGDGYSGDAGDCDDGNNHTYPGAAEVPDGQDNDCDGEVDEDTSSGCGGPGLGGGLRGSAVAGLLGLVLVRLRRRR